MIAICKIRDLPHYRKQAFLAGLIKAGYRIVENGRPQGPEDLLVQWNRYGAMDQLANQWEACGGTVLVCENGYLGKDEQGRQYYAISAHGHNGSGWFPVGSDDRFSKLGVAVKPFRERGAHIVVRGQRGIGTPSMASPPNWHETTAARVRKFSTLPVRVVPHPGNVPDRSGSHHLPDAHALYIWSSAMGVYALTEGVPVVYAAPFWICEGAASRFSDSPEYVRDDAKRDQALRKMAHGQWSVAEIESGEPFARFLEHVLRAAAA